MRCAPWLGRELQLDAISPRPARPSCFARGNRKSGRLGGPLLRIDRSGRPPAGLLMRLAAKQIISHKTSGRVFSPQSRKVASAIRIPPFALTIATRRYRGIDDERRKLPAR